MSVRRAERERERERERGRERYRADGLHSQGLTHPTTNLLHRLVSQQPNSISVGAIRCGELFSVAVSTGKMYTFGRSDAGQLGTGDFLARKAPFPWNSKSGRSVDGRGEHCVFLVGPYSPPTSTHPP